MQSSLEQYTPAWWTNGHIQAFLPFLVPQTRIKYKRDIVELKDGGRASLDWVIESSAPRSSKHTSLRDDAPIALVMHGLTGCSRSMRTLCADALGNGYRPVVFNKRGHGGVQLTTPMLQEFGSIEDLQQAITQIEKAFPSSRLYGIGYSAGAALLCSYLGETGHASRIDAGVFISPGYNVFDLFCRGRVHRVYDFMMTFTLKKFLLRNQQELRDVIDISAALKATSVSEFDEQVYMRMHGYKDLEAYWLRNNPMRAIENIQRPILCINALDDPVCTKETIPYDQFVDNPIAMLVETGEGSHCAFYEGNMFLKSWANKAAMQYFGHVREFQLEKINEDEVSATVQG